MNISFVVPAYNEEAVIARCIKSIQAEAGNFPHEIIVVDNGSTDRTIELAEKAGAHVFYAKQKGVTRARQKGFDVARYDTIAFIDADNEIPNGWLAHALTNLMPPQVVAVSGPVVYQELGVLARVVSFGFYLVANVAHHIFPMLQGGNFVLKRSALTQAGGFPDLDFWGEDTETGRRLSRVGVVNFDLNMWAYSSGRRVMAEGLFMTGARYAVNYLSIHLFGKPASKSYNDIRVGAE